jgi:predicted small metal-binding protein
MGPPRASDERRGVAKQIRCDCGKIVRGETDDELRQNAEAHIREDHPDLVGKVSLDGIVAMAEEI